MRLGSLLITAAICVASPSLACVYEPIVPVEDDGRTVFLGTCGFYETGYRLDGSTLHFPDGSTHAITNVSKPEAQAALKEAYGLIEVGDDVYVRTKDVIQPRRPEGVEG